MKQRKLHSLGEAVVNNILSFGVAYGINLIVIPIFRKNCTDKETAFWLTFLFTIVSIIRSYFLRRLFNWYHHRHDKL